MNFVIDFRSWEWDFLCVKCMCGLLTFLQEQSYVSKIYATMEGIKIGVISFKRSCRFLAAIALCLLLITNLIHYLLSNHAVVQDIDLIHPMIQSQDSRLDNMREIFHLRSVQLKNYCRQHPEWSQASYGTNVLLFQSAKPDVSVCKDSEDTFYINKFLRLLDFKPSKGQVSPDGFKAVMVQHPFLRLIRQFESINATRSFPDFVQFVIDQGSPIDPYWKSCSICNQTPDLVIKLDQQTVTKEVSFE